VIITLKANNEIHQNTSDNYCNDGKQHRCDFGWIIGQSIDKQNVNPEIG
jgi:hypothetical protein